MTSEDPEGGLDLSALLNQLGQVQNSLQEAQASAAAQVVEGTAGGGMVRVSLTGGFEFQSVTIAPEVVDPSDVEMLQDLVLAAIRDGLERANDLQQAAMGSTDPTAALGGLFGALGGGEGPFGADLFGLGAGEADEDPAGSGEPTGD
jgi:nucleoid-associated protein EbfC